MKILIQKKGSTSMFVLISILFFLIFLISIYGYITSSEKTQLDQISIIKDTYEKNLSNIDAIYEKIITNSKMIPIYDSEQFLKIGSGQDVQVGDRQYNYASNVPYRLMADIEINYEELPIANFEGILNMNNHTITILANQNVNEGEIKLFQSSSAQYYNENIKLKIVLSYTITPKPETATVTITSNDKVLASGTGEQKVDVDKGTQVRYEVSQDGYETISGEDTVEDNITKEINLEKTKYTFTINPTPSNATVKMNDNVINSVQVEEGTKVSWSVSLDGYDTQSGTETINDNLTKDINLKKSKYTFTINPTPSNATVTINGTSTKSVQVEAGTTVSWSVSLSGYVTQSGTETVNSNTTKNITLNKVSYSYTVTPNPSDANVSISANGTTLKSGNGAQTVSVESGTTITWTVSKTYYQTKTESKSVTENGSKTVTLSENPTQTLSLTPYDVSTSGSITYPDRAIADDSNDLYARGSGTCGLEWKFNSSSLNSNAKITNITLYYKICNTIAGTSSTITLTSGSKTFFTRKIDDIGINGAVFSGSATTMPTPAEIKSGLVLKATKDNTSSLSWMRWYGARLEISYINP